MEKFTFKKFGGAPIEDLGAYLRDYLKEFPNTSVYVGTDSQNFGPKTRYVTVVGLYDEVRNDGVHYVLSRKHVDREKDIFSRMWNEATASLDVAEYLEKELEGVVSRLSADDIAKIRSDELKKPLSERDPLKVSVGAYQNKLVNIDLDINPELGEGRNKSNVAYLATKSYLTGLGYRVRYKPFAWAASCAADFRVKSGGRKYKKRLRRNKK